MAQNIISRLIFKFISVNVEHQILKTLESFAKQVYRSISACFGLLCFCQTSNLLNQQYFSHITGSECQKFDSFLKSFACDNKSWCKYFMQLLSHSFENIFLYQKEKRNTDLSEKHCLLCYWKLSLNYKICITCDHCVVTHVSNVLLSCSGEI